MVKRAVFILAAGDGKRWHQGEEWPQTMPKQLLELGNETIIGRTIRLVQGYGIKPVVVTHNPAIRAALNGQIEFYNPGQHRWLMETLQSTQPLWKTVNVALWSDVVYSEAVMDAMLSDESAVKFYGRWGDGYGIVWRKSNRRFAEGIKVVIEDAEQNDDGIIPVGRNWELYRWFQGWDLHQHIGPDESNEYYELVPRTDPTCDVDTPQDWEVVQREVLAEL